MSRGPPRPTLFPYTPLFRSLGKTGDAPVVRGSVQPCGRQRLADGAGRGRLARQLQQVGQPAAAGAIGRSEEHTSELQSLTNVVCRLLLERKKQPLIMSERDR